MELNILVLRLIKPNNTLRDLEMVTYYHYNI